MKPSFRTASRVAKDRRLADFAHPSAFRWLTALVATSLSVGALMAAVLPALIGAESGPRPSAPSEAAAPAPAKTPSTVYELPSVTVVANRKAELAKIEREERVVSMQQVTRSKPAAKPPA